jgi:uncharacterized protein YndB with AHSA1/START domain
MPTARIARPIPAPIEQVWEIVADPHHLPRWWPRVARVEGVQEDGGFTEVLTTPKGRTLRVDFSLLENQAPAPGAEAVRRWSQELDEGPFQRMLKRSETTVRLRPDGQETQVTLELVQETKGFFNRFGGGQLKRASRGVLGEALDGLEHLFTADG